MILSLALHTAIIIAMMPLVVPLTKKKLWSAPAKSAISSWASAMTPVGCWRESRPMGALTSLRKVFAPKKSFKRFSTLPIWCPGTSKGEIFSLTYLIRASRNGVWFWFNFIAHKSYIIFAMRATKSNFHWKLYKSIYFVKSRRKKSAIASLVRLPCLLSGRTRL